MLRGGERLWFSHNAGLLDGIPFLHHEGLGLVMAVLAVRSLQDHIKGQVLSLLSLWPAAGAGPTFGI